MSVDPYDSAVKRSTPRPRTPRPTTPLRTASQASFRESTRAAADVNPAFPLSAFENAFAELSDAMTDLEANMMHFQIMHESLARFSESFASFLYGLNMNAFCVDFPEGPIPESFKRERDAPHVPSTPKTDNEGETTIMYVEKTHLPASSLSVRTPYLTVSNRTTDTTFVDNPPTVSKPRTRSALPEPRQSRLPATRGGTTARRATRARGRASGLARATGRGGR